jgi:hypothetical protein
MGSTLTRFSPRGGPCLLAMTERTQDVYLCPDRLYRERVGSLPYHPKDKGVSVTRLPPEYIRCDSSLMNLCHTLYQGLFLICCSVVDTCCAGHRPVGKSHHLWATTKPSRLCHQIDSVEKTRDSMTRQIAAAVSSEVKSGMPRAMASRRICLPSMMVSWPLPMTLMRVPARGNDGYCSLL